MLLAIFQALSYAERATWRLAPRIASSACTHPPDLAAVLTLSYGSLAVDHAFACSYWRLR